MKKSTTQKKSATQKKFSALWQLKTAVLESDRNLSKLTPADLTGIGSDTCGALLNLKQAHLAVLVSLDREARPEVYARLYR